ncbi:MAG TPA: dihydroorotate dehydrogenase electron transfer subunit, partial [Bacteroidota bacterium]|nr:dihydroorotate dehydrogenase electron transfer subunit [Bacteroidota bacterium]
ILPLSMIHTVCPVTSNLQVGPEIYVLKFHSPEIASAVQPGQFVNVKVNDAFVPLLRRPFSVYYVEKKEVAIIFNVAGTGTKILSEKKAGETVDIIGPLGCAFRLDERYETALLVAGGMGVAPFPFMTSKLQSLSKSIVTLLGARSKDFIIPAFLKNISIATDNGSIGFHGTVVDLLREGLSKHDYVKPKIFACGPNPMLRNVCNVAEEFHLPCELSLESVMGCGIGICQGCPVERRDGEKKYALVCKEGPVFDYTSIRV